VCKRVCVCLRCSQVHIIQLTPPCCSCCCCCLCGRSSFRPGAVLS
jgi:hypothetical protein